MPSIDRYDLNKHPLPEVKLLAVELPVVYDGVLHASFPSKTLPFVPCDCIIGLDVAGTFFVSDGGR